MSVKQILRGWVLSFCLIQLVGLFHIFVLFFVAIFSNGWGNILQEFSFQNYTEFGELIYNAIPFILAFIITAVGIFFIGLPIYAIIYAFAHWFAKWFIVKFSPNFGLFFLAAYVLFGGPFAAIAIKYIFSDMTFPSAVLIHMAPFYAFILVPFNIGYIWLSVVDKP